MHSGSMDLVLLEKAQVALVGCLQVRSDETVLVVDDGTLSPRLSQAFATAVHHLGGVPLAMSYMPTRYVSMREFGVFAGASFGGRPLPRPLLDAIAAADAVVILNSDMSIMFDAGFVERLGGSVRIAWAPYFTEDAFLRLMPDAEEEALELSDATTRVGERFRGSHDVTVTSETGTDLTMRIGDYRVNWGTGRYEQGRGYGGLEIWPGGQISTVPVAGSATGRLVIDRSVNVPEYRELLDPIAMTVQEGYVTDIRGDIEARRLREFLEDLDDPEAYHLTELGVGTNRRCKMAGLAAPAEDTHTWGCVSLALGADVHLGGETRAGCHVDMTMHSATLHLDDRPLVSAGRLVDQGRQE